MIESILAYWHFSLSNLSGLSLPLDVHCFLSSEQLDMGLGREIGADSTVSSVSSSASLGSSVNLDVVDSKVFKILGVGV